MGLEEVWFVAIGVLQSIHMQARLSQKGRFAW